MNSRKQWVKDVTRARRIASCLNKAIRNGNRKKIKHWQKISLKYYGVIA